ncbi:MAG TPA: ATP-binding cassette domain-containing protein [Kofleriaceae bacterium]|jgi:ABC-2 type transport system ATP-binding protein
MVYDNAVRSTNKAGVRAEGLGKRYGDLWALRGLDLHAPAGTVLGLLGHNGAGKTTAVRIFATLALPTEGRAEVAGFDVVRDAAKVRASIGLAAQAATVDGLLSARKNLEMVGRLYHLPVAEAKRRAEELLARVALTDSADKLVKTFSGGMRRRLDLAATLVARPPVLFLDEPTTGLDPHARNELWALLREHVRDGATVVLTTQYLEEADRLADDIVVLDRGRVAEHGTPAELKARIGGDRIVITLTKPDDLEAARAAMLPFASGPATIEEATVQVVAPVKPGTRLVEVLRELDASRIDAHEVHRREVTLDDVFLAITSREAAKDAAGAQEAA